MNIECIPDSLIVLIELLRARLRSADFLNRHRRQPQDFTRRRCLTFPIVMLLILQKSVKSVQRHLHEFLARLAEGTDWEPVTAGAWTQARAKLRAGAFTELNTQCVLPLVYGPERAGGRQDWRGHRLLGLDSSLVRLPYSAELAGTFRVVEVRNQHGALGPRYCEGRESVLYDLLNHVGLDGRLVSGSQGEVSLAEEQLAHLQPGDVTLTDCGYTGYRFLARVRQHQAHFVARCSRGSFLPALELFRGNRAGRSVVTRLWAPADQRVGLKKLGLHPCLWVRLVSVRLPDGQLEVLVTSLLSEELYPTAEFADLYHRRWGHETYHLLFKSRLDLENWSGQTEEAIRQDFAATLFLANLESVLTQPANAALARRGSRQPQQINHAVSYHAIKDQALDLLHGDTPARDVIGQLQKLFLGSPVTVRPKPKPRRKESWGRSYHFQRHVRKIVF
ncbi:MAG TPA: IS4 family transposase [Candidatus Saccharimonadales bacterium]|nr:IS4 family transposase [Candidatus Saccharimonadales bacterium]